MIRFIKMNKLTEKLQSEGNGTVLLLVSRSDAREYGRVEEAMPDFGGPWCATSNG